VSASVEFFQEILSWMQTNNRKSIDSSCLQDDTFPKFKKTRSVEHLSREIPVFLLLSKKA
jgi:hypothetical protein